MRGGAERLPKSFGGEVWRDPFLKRGPSTCLFRQAPVGACRKGIWGKPFAKGSPPNPLPKRFNSPAARPAAAATASRSGRPEGPLGTVSISRSTLGTL